MRKDLFRKEVFERLSAPDNTDELITQPRLSSWIALAGLVILLGAIFVWVLGITMYFEVKGEGILVGNSSDVEALLYVPLEDGMKVSPGMNAQISPVTLEKDEFAFISGKVTNVSQWPLSKAEVAQRLGNPELADHYIKLAGGAPFEVNISLLHEPNNKTAYLWSDSVMEPVEIKKGVPCQGSIIIRTKKPISMILPWLESIIP